MGIEMRVIAGTARSLRLFGPDGQGTRPTTDRIKETLFNVLRGEMSLVGPRPIVQKEVVRYEKYIQDYL